MAVQFSADARRDLVDIARFIAEDSPHAAETFTAKLVVACEALGHYPELYPLLDRYSALGYRRRPFQNYVIIYVASEGEVQVVRVLSTWVDLETTLGD